MGNLLGMGSPETRRTPAAESEAETRLIRYVQRFNRDDTIERLALKTWMLERREFDVDGSFRPLYPPERFWLPQYLLLLVELALEFGRRDAPVEPPSSADLEQMVRLVHELAAWVPSRNVPNRATAILRTALHVQGPFMTTSYWSDLARLHSMACPAGSTSACGKALERATGVPAETLIASLCLVWIRFMEVDHRDPFVDPSLFEIDNGGPLSAAVRGLLCATPDEASEFCAQHRAVGRQTRLGQEAWVRSPLLLRPIVQTQRGAVVLGARTLGYALREGLLWQLKEQGENARRAVEDALEHHVRRVGVECSDGWADESALKRTLGDGLTVDGGFRSGNAWLLVECKAIGLKRKQLLRPSRQVMAQASKNSLVKAYVQAVATSTRLAAPSDAAPVHPVGLIIVTLGEHLASDFSALWEDFLRDACSVAIEKAGMDFRQACRLLPPSRVHIADVREFERIMSQTKLDPEFPRRLFAHVSAQTDTLEGKRATLAQHLDDLSVGEPTLAFLDTSWRRLEVLAKRLVSGSPQ